MVFRFFACICAYICYSNGQRESTVDITEPVASSAIEIERPKRLSLSSSSDVVEGPQRVWNDGRRFSVDVLAAVSDDRRPTTADRSQQQQVSAGRGRAPTRVPRLPAAVQVKQRRTSQPTPVWACQLPGEVFRQAKRRFSDNNGATCSSDSGSASRERCHNVETPATTSARLCTNTQLKEFTRRQSVQSNPPVTIRDERAASRRSSEGRGVTQVDTWWTKSTRRQSSSSRDQTDRPLPAWVHYQKRRSAPEVAFTKSYRREFTSASRQTTGEKLCDQMTKGRELPQLDRNETSSRKRWNVSVKRFADDSFDSMLTSGLPSPSDSLASDYSSTPSLSDIVRGSRKDSGFRSIDTQSSYGASRKNSTGGFRRQSFQTTDINTSRHHSIPFVANPLELPGRPCCRPAAKGPRSSGRRQSMFTRSDEVGGGESDWLKDWLRWRSGCSDSNDVELLDLRCQAPSNRHAYGVWNSLSEKVERTFEGFDRAISRATALLHNRRMSSESDCANHIEC